MEWIGIYTEDLKNVCLKFFEHHKFVSNSISMFRGAIKQKQKKKTSRGKQEKEIYKFQHKILLQFLWGSNKNKTNAHLVIFFFFLSFPFLFFLVCLVLSHLYIKSLEEILYFNPVVLFFLSFSFYTNVCYLFTV